MGRLKQMVRRGLAHAVAQLPPGVLTDHEHADIFSRRGYHVVPKHFYQPVPDVDVIDHDIWEHPNPMLGVRKNIEASRAFLSDAARDGHLAEFYNFPRQSLEPHEYTREGSFGGPDAAAYYFVLRRNGPRQVIEIGAGQSTLLARSALTVNNRPWRMTAIDPYPQPYLRTLPDPSFTLIDKPVERVSLSTFETLEANDVLFIDSSHAVRIGGDVIYELLDILPRLKRGVVIYIHDIYLPFHYRKDWVLRERRFWAEQYMVQAFLAFNSAFEIEWLAGTLVAEHIEEMQPHFPDWNNALSPVGSLIIRHMA